MTAVVSAYRCGAAPDFHRVPSYRDHNRLWSTSNRAHPIVLQSNVNRIPNISLTGREAPLEAAKRLESTDFECSATAIDVTCAGRASSSAG
jgi:hypothetical protein